MYVKKTILINNTLGTKQKTKLIAAAPTKLTNSDLRNSVCQIRRGKIYLANNMAVEDAYFNKLKLYTYSAPQNTCRHNGTSEYVEHCFVFTY